MPHHPTHLALTFSTTPTMSVQRRDYHGYTIVTETDLRGAEYGECVTIEGVDGDFNSDEDAADYIDEVLDVDCGVEYAGEHWLRSHELI